MIIAFSIYALTHTIHEKKREKRPITPSTTDGLPPAPRGNVAVTTVPH